MALAPLLAFTRANVELVPQIQGIYCLYAKERLIYIGCTLPGGAGMRQRLMRHLDGEGGAWKERASHFAIEVTDQPTEKRWLLLNAYFNQHGVAPLYNVPLSG